MAGCIADGVGFCFNDTPTQTCTGQFADYGIADEIPSELNAIERQLAPAQSTRMTSTAQRVALLKPLRRYTLRVWGLG
jgi:hypothetical protein